MNSETQTEIEYGIFNLNTQFVLKCHHLTHPSKCLGVEFIIFNSRFDITDPKIFSLNMKLYLLLLLKHSIDFDIFQGYQTLDAYRLV